VRLGIGDDAALVEVRRGHELILTTDLSLEGIHFVRALHPPRAIGHRALARSLSDVAAMGGVPRFALVSLALSRRISRSWLKGFYSGVFALAQRFTVTVVGGDTAVIPGSISIDVMVAGEIARGRAIRRSGARPGDQLFVSGRLGLSAMGLQWLKANARTQVHSKRAKWNANPKVEINDAVQAHLYPEPRCALGRFLSHERLTSALIDVSDGFSTDLKRLCLSSGVGARVWADRLPLPDVALAGVSAPTHIMNFALHGGEDYELLFTVPKLKASRIPRKYRGVSLHHVGEITRSTRIMLSLHNGREVPLKSAGYDHFAKED
jgi:thiamine-monophosphate kinase